ncbi:MFS transporter [Bradyrhizobium ontarionense]|uniref:MFS transporter n=1 Tax=Bradyrhizobium ontarionense TaxID=2898149 RepID=UPI00211308BA|nr:MFS transporter [Bradyrhizobium sp. A19]
MPNASSTNRTAASPSPVDRTAQHAIADSQHAGGALSTLIAACVSGFLFQFDLTALSAALPDIASSLSADVADQAWVIDVYSLALIFALPLAGPVADRYGRRRMFMTGAVVFALASALCATATTLSGLLAWRVLQGISGAALTASASALLAVAYPGPRRAWAFGICGTVIGASMVAGPPLGAVIAAVSGWPWVFWINLPICVALVLLTARTASDQALSRTYAPLDWAGPAALALAVGSLASLMLAGHGPAGPVVMPMPVVVGGCVGALALFIRVERQHVAPAFDFALFGSSRFVAMCLVPIAGSIGFWALLVHLPQMARGPMALSPAATGFLLTALTVPMVLLPSVGAKLAAKLPARWYFAGGLGIVGGADLLLALAARDLGAPLAIWAVVGALLIGGCGCAVFNAQIAAAAVSAVPPDRAATASAISVTMRQIGFAFGIALIGALLERNDPYAYTTAFTVVAACTLGLAVVAFALLGRSKG